MKPFQPMAWRLPNSDTPQGWDRSQMEVIDPDEGDVQPVDFIGSGVIMFPTDALLSLDKPWFFETINPETQQRVACMDTKFVWRLKTEGGIRMYVDTTIKVKHVHDMEIDDTFQDRFDDYMEVGPPDICQYQEVRNTRPVTPLSTH